MFKITHVNKTFINNSVYWILLVTSMCCVVKTRNGLDKKVRQEVQFRHGDFIVVSERLFIVVIFVESAKIFCPSRLLTCIFKLFPFCWQRLYGCRQITAVVLKIKGIKIYVNIIYNKRIIINIIGHKFDFLVLLSWHPRKL